VSQVNPQLEPHRVVGLGDAADSYYATLLAQISVLNALWLMTKNTHDQQIKDQSQNCWLFGASPDLLGQVQQCSSMACEATNTAELAAIGYANRCGSNSGAWNLVQAVQADAQTACPADPRCHIDPNTEDSFGLVWFDVGSGGEYQGGFDCLDERYFNCIAGQVGAAQDAFGKVQQLRNMCPITPAPTTPRPTSRVFHPAVPYVNRQIRQLTAG
jgi:hypothetical protein